MRISIRAPARGATTVSVCAEFSGSNFNPRSREGSDAWQKADWLYYQISIRAPARGATGRPCQLLYVKGFQSALPRGERLPLTRGMLQVHDFNPRSREGSDDGTQLSVRYGCYFNPRSREGSDQSHKPRTAILQAFQSALPRGERRCTSSGISVAM